MARESEEHLRTRGAHDKVLARAEVERAHAATDYGDVEPLADEMIPREEIGAGAIGRLEAQLAPLGRLDARIARRRWTHDVLHTECGHPRLRDAGWRCTTAEGPPIFDASAKRATGTNSDHR